VDEGAGDGVLLLHRQVQYMRNQFGHFINDEKHDGEELTVGGRQHSRDPMGMMEDTTDDGETWDKTTARSRRLATRKESSNGTAEQWLAGDERAAVAHLGIGEKAIKGVEASAKRVFIGGGERERERGVVVSHIGDRMPASSRTGGAMAYAGFPCCEPLMGGPQSGFEL
jgi:hypothetical protein